MRLPNVADVWDFVAWEERQLEKYEFADGEISLFPGGTARHEIIVANLIVALHPAAPRGSVRASGLKAVTPTSSRYPDVSVSIDPRDSGDLRYARYPLLLVEVLSPSTFAVDRGAKLAEYRSIETLREYVLVDSRARWVQAYRRGSSGWVASVPIAFGRVAFESLDLEVAFDDIYAGSGL